MQRFISIQAIDAQVSQATDLISHQHVVLKRGNRAALDRELRLLSQLRHPVLRRVVDYTNDSIALEHLPGVPLDALDLSAEDFVEVATQVLRGLLCLHSAGYVHGDVKVGNIIVEATRAKLIDLGLSVLIGTSPQGGSKETLPPEYLTGATASVAGDLYSFGVTFRSVAPATLNSAWSEALDRCSHIEPTQRPSSAAALMAALNIQVEPIDRLGISPRLSDKPLVKRANMLLSKGVGDCLLIAADKGYGCTRLIEDLFAKCAKEEIPTVILNFSDTQQLSPLVGLAEALGTHSPQETAAVLVRSGRRLLCDGCIGLDEDEHDFVRSAMQHAVELKKSAMVFVGDLSQLSSAGDVATLTPWEEKTVTEAAAHYGLRGRDKQLRQVLAQTKGAPGKTMRALSLWSRFPERSIADLLSEDVETSSLGVAPHLYVAHIESALAAGACSNAERLIAGLDEGDQRSRMSARVAARRGDDDLVLSCLATIDTPIAADIVLRVSSLQRLGRNQEAIDIAAISNSPELTPAWAKALRGLGRLAESGDLVRTSLEKASASQAIDLLNIASDVALQLGDLNEAKSHAQRALKRSKQTKSFASIAASHARLGGVFGMQGHWKKAKTHYASALAAMRDNVELGALSTYMMNLAVADHALGSYREAIAMYERAAKLADRFSRHNSAYACRVNLAGLLCSIGAKYEARTMLEDIDALSDTEMPPMFKAQSVLLRAEVSFAHEGLTWAKKAKQLFLHIGASRHVCEAELIYAHRLVEAGRHADAAAALPVQQLADEFGLLARWRLVDALSCSDRVRQRTLAVDAVQEALNTSDPMLQLKCLSLATELHSDSAPEQAADFFEKSKEIERALKAKVPSDMGARLSLPKTTDPTKPTVTQRSDRLSEDARRLLSLSRRILLERDESRVLSYALDEAIVASAAERAFLLRRKPKRAPQVVAARNFDKETIRNSRFRFSRSVAKRVLSSGETVLTASAMTDPSLSDARSIHDLGVRSVLCVPIASPEGLIGALYLDHRFSESAFSNNIVELVQGIADLIGLSLENNRLYQESERRAMDLEKAHTDLRADAARQAIELARLSSELASVSIEENEEEGIVGQSPSIRLAIDTAKRVAPSDLSVVIQGESGTGKELFAKLIHQHSLRKGAPFIAINCASLSESLLESELFGHMRGAFTGAVRDHIGIFRSAVNGTVFLDEIGEMPINMQTRLLRVLQEKQVRPVGGTEAVPVDVRVVAATNKNLQVMTETKAFRRDLFFRLAGAVVELPALRQRKEDIPRLIASLTARIAAEPGMKDKRLGADAMRLVLSYKWPGNIRELEQSLRRAILVSDGDEIRAQDLMLTARSSASRGEAIHAFDRALLMEALHAAGGNKSKAARELGISRVTLYRWLNRYEIG